MSCEQLADARTRDPSAQGPRHSSGAWSVPVLLCPTYVSIFVDGRLDWVPTVCGTEKTEDYETGVGSSTQE